MGTSCHKLGNAGKPQSDGRGLGSEQHQHDSDEAADAVPGKLSPFRRSDSFRTSPSQPAPRPPKLVRGWTATEQSEDKLAIMMANVVPEWSGIDPSRIQVQCKSGQGRLSTYKVSADGVQPPHVALHCWDEEAMEDPLSVERTGTAAELFSAHGAAPRRLAAGGDWFAEVWEGTGPELSDAVLEELGRLIADVHSWPTTWFDPFRARLKERWPFLESVPDASHVWPSTCREENLAELSEEALAAWLRPQAFTPATKIGARAVTVHADIHMFNLLQTDDGLRIIDFEWTVVAHAAQDLATVVRVCCPKDLRQKRLFVKAYLTACAASTDSEDVDQLLFDAEVCFLTSHMGPLFPGDDDDEHRWLSNLEDFNSFISFARASPTLRAKVLEDGIVRYVKDIRVVVKAGSPVVLCTCQNLVNDYFFLHDDGTLSPDARRDLALGTDADGWVVLAHRSGGDVLRFQVVDAKGTTPQALTLQSEVGRGVVIAEETMVGPSQVQKLRLGKASDAVIVVADGSIVRLASDDALALHVGDPAFELARKQNQELYAAAKEGNLATMEQLIGEGADVNWPREHESLGHVAAREGQSQALKVLLAHGFDVNTRPCGAIFQPCSVELLLCR
eukprot:s1025_g2.t1